MTIVTPSFNQGEYLEETIQSVLAQEYPNLEYIIIDGGSTDNSVDIIKKYESSLAYWTSEPDNGQADAINKGFKRSTGEFLGWINSDDILYPNALKRVVETFNANPTIDLIYGDINQGCHTDEALIILRGQQLTLRDMLRTLQVPIPQQGSLWRRSAMDIIGMLNTRWHVVLDREFFTRLAQHSKILYLPGILGFFRIHNNSKSMTQHHHWLTELPKMYQQFFIQTNLPKNLRDLQRETMGAVFLTCASIAHKSGESGKIVMYLAKAFQTDPLFIFRRFLRLKAAKLLRTLLNRGIP